MAHGGGGGGGFGGEGGGGGGSEAATNGCGVWGVGRRKGPRVDKGLVREEGWTQMFDDLCPLYTVASKESGGKLLLTELLVGSTMQKSK